MRNLIIFSLIIILIVSLSRKDVWSGYFYPDASNLSTWVEAEETFNNIEACRSWARQEADLYLLENYSSIEEYKWDYECGLNCKHRDGFNVCKETIH